MNNNLQNFYKSRKWENFVRQLRLARVDPSGILICEYCGTPILKPYDCIAHHKIELTEDNVNDCNVSLNPNNIMLIHFKCHNKLHKRFGFNDGISKKTVYIVYGSPCSGKSTYVDNISDNSDIILNIDRLWAAVRSSKCGQYEKPKELLTNVFALRDCMLDMIKVRRGNWHNAYIIGGYPTQVQRDRIADTVGADKLIFIDTPKDVCLLRAKEKSPEWTSYVEKWFDEYTPPLN